MRTRLTSVVTVILMVIAIAPSVAAAEPVAPEEANDSWIVTLVPGAPAPAVAAGLVSRSGGTTLDGVFEHVLNGFVFSGSEAAAAALQKNPNVVSVTRNGTLRLADTQPEGTLRIEADDTNGAGFTGMTETGTPVRVAVLDSGVLATHPDLAPNVAIGEGKNCIDPNNSPDDDNGHGTHVAGTVAALLNGIGVVGVAPDASISAIKVFDQSGYGSDAQIICGLDHVAALAADGVPTVINMSFGEMRSEATGCSSSPLHEAICSLHDMGIVMVAATGNNGGSASSFYPAAYPETIAVSAFTDFNGQGGASSGCTLFPDIANACDETLGWFSNDGPKVDVAAPGVNVLSTTYDGGYGRKTGTSMAAPHVAGVAALVLGANPQLNPTTVKSVLTNTGECPDGAMAGAATCVGHGAWDMADQLFGSSPEPDGITEPLVDALAATQMAVALAGPDVTPPVITLLGADPQYVVVGDGYVEQNATAFDFVDGDISSSIVIDASAVNTAVPGSYPVTYNVSDAAGNAADEVTRTVIVEATPPPVGTLSLTADNAMEAFVNGASIGSSSDWRSALVADVGLHAGDVVAVAATDVDGVAAFLAQIDWDGGTFVSDTSWKVSTTAPAGWNQAGFDDSAWDNATSYGTYGVAPWGTDVAGFPTGSFAEWIWTNDNDGDNQAYFRLVIGEPSADVTPPVITLLGPNPQYITVGDGYVEQNATAIDNRDGDISSSIVINASAVNTAVPGSYPVTYNVSDAAGNAADEVTRTVIVEEPSTSATITFTGDNAVEGFVNGVSIGSSSNWKQASTVTLDLETGDVVAFAATDAGGVGGLLAQIDWDGGNKFVTNTLWKVSTTAPAGWNQAGFDDSAWDNATSYGTYGAKPWGTRVAGFPTGSSAEWIWTNDSNGDNQAYFRLVIGG